MTTPPKLFKHQKTTVAFLKKAKRVFDMSDPGTGKTPVQILAFAERRRKGGGKALILAPKSLLFSAWYRDFQKFAPDMKVSLAYASNRTTALGAEADVYVTNHDAAKALFALPSSYWKGFDTLIVDECTAFKHHTSARSKAVGKLVKYFDYRRLLSATPTSNGVCDIWHQVKLLDDGKRLGASFFSFRAAVCTPKSIGMVNVVKWEDKSNAEAIVSALISDITIRHKFDECVDIPPNHQYAVDFQLSKSHLAQYKQLEVESVLALQDNKLVSAVNAAVLYNKLLQLSSGAVYSSTGEYTVVDPDRYELVMDLAEQRAHSIVFFNWTHQRDQLVAEAEKRGMSYGVYDGLTPDGTRQRLVDQFQAGMLRVLFAHPQSAGHGLTLTRGVATIWASPTWNLEHYLQGLKRIHRIGQSVKTETIMVLAQDTIETKVYDALMRKESRMDNLLTFLKEAA